jgi:hypothetical protein
MRKSGDDRVLRGLASSVLGDEEEALLAAVLRNLRIVGRTLPTHEAYERARMAAVEVVLEHDGQRSRYAVSVF